MNAIIGYAVIVNPQQPKLVVFYTGQDDARIACDDLNVQSNERTYYVKPVFVEIAP